jgi:hypothetical protein
MNEAGRQQFRADGRRDRRFDELASKKGQRLTGRTD